MRITVFYELGIIFVCFIGDTHADLYSQSGDVGLPTTQKVFSVSRVQLYICMYVPLVTALIDIPQKSE